MRKKGNLTHDEIVAMYQTHSVNQIAARDGTSYVNVLRILHRAGVQMRTRGNNGINPPITHGLCRAAKALGMTPYRYVRLLAIMLLGGSCADCGNDDLRVLDLNHINGEGAPQRQMGNTTSLKYEEHVRIVAGERPRNVEVLCCNCNRLHEYVRGNIPPIPEKFLCQKLSPLKSFRLVARRSTRRRSIVG